MSQTTYIRSTGVSSLTGVPFSPPIGFRVSKRRPAEIRKHEKSELLHGKCHKCDKWVPVEGVKIGEVKVHTPLYLPSHTPSLRAFVFVLIGERAILVDFSSHPFNSLKLITFYFVGGNMLLLVTGLQRSPAKPTSTFETTFMISSWSMKNH